ncbi:hypothetical protein E1091_01315 [Micromonospora fluostatini]|uniref:Uncharacterized protein n=1 Tax=Micromonospora fluostatini TaxID=1629071 RepID=A0ABY2DLN3_9ACTN|nr:hypothetical protein E1091_01315 [Micromonospora fluostatini]
MSDRIAHLPTVERVAIGLWGVHCNALTDVPDRLPWLIEQWLDGTAPQKDHWISQAIEVLRLAQVNPGLLRWCDWSGCVASYDATTGPGESGWMRHRSDALLCPEHDGRGHHPSFTWHPELTALIAACSCGERSEPLIPTNRGAVLAWWANHIAQLPEGEGR